MRTCRVCGCTDMDCRQCIEATGEPCSWWHEYSEHPDGPICSACAIEIVLHGTGEDEPLGILHFERVEAQTLLTCLRTGADTLAMLDLVDVCDDLGVRR